jgi:hypothetical protein
VVLNDVRPVTDVQLMNLYFEKAPRWEDLVYISQLLARNRGNNPVILTFRDGTRIKAAPKFWVNGNAADIKSQLETHFGQILKVG